MKLKIGKSNDEIKKLRQERYLQLWPIHRQMEAHADAASGKPEKLNSMLEDFSRIKQELPYR